MFIGHLDFLVCEVPFLLSYILLRDVSEFFIYSGYESFVSIPITKILLFMIAFFAVVVNIGFLLPG